MRKNKKLRIQKYEKLCGWIWWLKKNPSGLTFSLIIVFWKIKYDTINPCEIYHHDKEISKILRLCSV